MDFQTVLLAFINDLDLPLTARIDYFTDSDDLVVNPTSGGTVLNRFMDGTATVSLPFEVAIKHRDNQVANSTIWTISEKLSAFDLVLASRDGSYTFLKLEVDKPAVAGKDEQGFFIYTLGLRALLETERT